MKKLLAYCSSGIVLEYKDDKQTYRYWLSHGGIPLIYNKNYDFQNTYTIPNERCILFKELHATSSIRWGDYSIINDNRKYYYCYGRHNIRYDILIDFLKKNNIDFAIRGHTDNKENAYLLSDYYNEDQQNKFDTLPLNNINIHENNQHNESIIFPKNTFNNPYIKEVKQTNGYISRINTSKFKNLSINIKDPHNNDKIVYPLLTISTNSDIARSLNNDSFVILNIDSNNISYTKNNILNNIKK